MTVCGFCFQAAVVGKGATMGIEGLAEDMSVGELTRRVHVHLQYL